MEFERAGQYRDLIRYRTKPAVMAGILQNHLWPTTTWTKAGCDDTGLLLSVRVADQRDVSTFPYYNDRTSDLCGAVCQDPPDPQPNPDPSGPPMKRSGAPSGYQDPQAPAWEKKQVVNLAIKNALCRWSRSSIFLENPWRRGLGVLLKTENSCKSNSLQRIEVL